MDTHQKEGRRSGKIIFVQQKTTNESQGGGSGERS